MASLGFARVIHAWELLLAALKEIPELLALLATEQLALEKDLETAKALKVRQQAHIADRLELTQQIEEVVAHGSEIVIAIRAVAKGKIGFRSEQLKRFGVAPARARRRKPAEKPEGEPGAPEGPKAPEATKPVA